MPRKNTHPAICFVVLAAYLINLALVAGGAVLCQDPHAEARFELACDHDHCGPGVEGLPSELDHQHHPSDACSCSSCPCEDTSLGIVITATLNRDDQTGSLASTASGLLWYAPLVTPPPATVAMVAPARAPPAASAHLGPLRTIILVV